MSLGIEGHARDDSHVNLGIISKQFSHWFHNAKGTCPQVLSPSIAAQLHLGIADNTGQQDGLALHGQLVQQRLRLHLVGQCTI